MTAITMVPPVRSGRAARPVRCQRTWKPSRSSRSARASPMVGSSSTRQMRGRGSAMVGLRRAGQVHAQARTALQRLGIEFTQQAATGRVALLGQQDAAHRRHVRGRQTGCAHQRWKPEEGERRTPRLRAVRAGSRRARVSQT